MSKTSENLGPLAGKLYTAGLVPFTISAGVDKNPFGITSLALCLVGNLVMAKHGDKRAGMQAAQSLFFAGATANYMGGIIGGDSYVIGSVGSVTSLLLSIAEISRDEKGLTGDGTFTDKLVRHRAAIGGSMSFAARVPFVSKTWQSTCENTSVANVSMLLASIIWLVADICYALSTTKPEVANAR